MHIYMCMYIYTCIYIYRCPHDHPPTTVDTKELVGSSRQQVANTCGMHLARGVSRDTVTDINSV